MKILYICTHNRCRSILSEAISNHRAGELLIARSAGSQPADAVHPLTLKYLSAAGVPTEGLKSQSWDDYEDFAADVVITLCDSAAGESCPLWFGKALKLHWGLPDPSRLTGSQEDVDAAFQAVIRTIEQRVDALAEVAGLPASQWAEALQQLVAAD